MYNTTPMDFTPIEAKAFELSPEQLRASIKTLQENGILEVTPQQGMTPDYSKYRLSNGWQKTFLSNPSSIGSCC